jgi:hypothetical protein
MATPVSTDKDSYEFQRARIIRIGNELAPGKRVQFDETTSSLRFRIRDQLLGVTITESTGEWEPSELADKSDEWMRALLIHASNGKIRA